MERQGGEGNRVSSSMKWTESLGIGQLLFHLCSLSRVSLVMCVCESFCEISVHIFSAIAKKGLKLAMQA